MKRTVALSGVAAILILGLAFFTYAHRANAPVLSPQGIVGHEELRVIELTVALSSIVVIPVFILLFTFAWKYREGNPKADKKHQPNWDHDNWVIEFFWWLVPSVIIVILGVVAWQSSHHLDPYKPLTSSVAPITIQVVALDWKWLFIYPDLHIATVNMLEIPENTPIHFDITADAPMNSFWIPSLSGQIMAMPGMTNQLNVLADQRGTYRGLSGNISGKGFAGMTFTVKSVPKDEFNAWAQGISQTQGSHSLNRAEYEALAKPSEYVAPKYYSVPDTSLYTSILMSYMKS